MINTLSEELIAQFHIFLENKFGFSYKYENINELLDRLTPAVKAFGFTDSKTCIEWLLENPIQQEQIEILARCLTIGETYFFRDINSFKVLEEVIFPSIINKRSNDRNIRVWCGACCTGEEPYSVAILLHQLIPNLKDWKISLLGTDINTLFLQKTKQARYKEWSFRSEIPELKKRYFTKNSDGQYLLNPEIKNMVDFFYLNLVDDKYPSLTNGTNGIDVILCNNVFIYFSEQQIANVTKKLAQALIEGGYLIVASIESSFIQHPDLRPCRIGNTIVFKKESSSNIKTIPQTTSSTALTINHTPAFKAIASSEIKLASPSTSNLDILKLWYLEGHYKMVIEFIEKLLKNENETEFLKNHSQEILLLIQSLANQVKLSQALNWCDKAIEINKIDPAPCYLKALILQELHDEQGSIHFFQRTLYLNPNFALAEFSLAVLLSRKGVNPEAKHHFKNTLKILESHHPSDILWEADAMSAEKLTKMTKNLYTIWYE